jgi:hypothetical protein
VHDLGLPPGSWVHASANDINNADVMAVSTDVFIASQPPRKAAETDSLGAYVARWSRGRVTWYRLNGTTTQFPGAAANTIAPDGDVAGSIFSFDPTTGDVMQQRPTLWVRHSPSYSYSARHPALEHIGDITSRSGEDFLVGRRVGQAAFLAVGRRPVALSLSGTPDIYGEAQSVASASRHVLYVTGVGSETLTPSGSDVETGLLWTIDCSSSFMCHQVGNPIVIKRPRNCFSAYFVAVNSHRLVAGSCTTKGGFYGVLPFVWQSGHVENLNRAVPAGSAHLDLFTDLNAKGQVTGGAVSRDGSSTPEFLATPTG